MNISNKNLEILKKLILRKNFKILQKEKIQFQLQKQKFTLLFPLECHPIRFHFLI